MKKLLFIHGPNGVGKSTLCRQLLRQLPNSAWLESEWCRMTNPFTFNPEIIAMVERNMTFLLRNYLGCSTLEYVIFNYALHGPRGQIAANVFRNLADLEFQLIPIIITCGEAENIRRMTADGRDEARIKRSLLARKVYEGLTAPTIDTTALTVAEAGRRVLDLAGVKLELG